MDKITEGNWGPHVLNFIIKGITDYHKKGEENPGLPWVSNSNREQSVERMGAEIDGHMAQSKKRKHVVEDSSPKQTQSYDGIQEVNLESENDPLFQGQTDQSSLNKPADSIVPIQTTATSPVPAIESFPAKSLREKISEERKKVRYMSTHSNPAPDDAVALMMMARTASYIPKEGLMPSFSLGLTDSS
ncbi:hypothetical protein Ahy_A03g014420 [Arachis hypogaea]|uniref:Uncharacterized protein n=1 Tax=Arachis hypogaea TaxID=3818 RepID=A0A445DXP0_ARAHY|nr:hypothetical protein Ahy_A03g014420 [Arachis hypogaea]